MEKSWGETGKGNQRNRIIVYKLSGKLAEIIEPNQFAYQHKIGVVDALPQLIDGITCDLDQLRVKFVQLTSLDFSKTFDGLQPAIALEEMTKYGFNQNVPSPSFRLSDDQPAVC